MYNQEIVSELNNSCYSGKQNIFGIDFYYDDNRLFEYYNHEPRLYFRNGYENEYDFIPITLSENVDYNSIRELATNVSPYTVLRLCEFVEKNYLQLLEIAHERGNFGDVINQQHKHVINETRTVIGEMAILRPKFTGLEDSIWIDNGADVQKSGHSGSDRIKYCTGDCDPKNSDTWCPVRISDGAFLYHSKKDWSSKGKKLLQKYIEANKDRLIQARIEKWSDEDLKTKLAYIGKYGNEIIEPPIRKEYYKCCDLDYGFIKVQEKNHNKFNLEKEGKIVSPIWFDFITPFNELRGEYCLGCAQGIYYNIYPNGTVKLNQISKLMNK